MIGGVTERKKNKKSVWFNFTFVQIKMDICPIKKIKMDIWSPQYCVKFFTRKEVPLCKI